MKVISIRILKLLNTVNHGLCTNWKFGFILIFGFMCYNLFYLSLSTSIVFLYGVLMLQPFEITAPPFSNNCLLPCPFKGVPLNGLEIYRPGGGG